MTADELKTLLDTMVQSLDELECSCDDEVCDAMDACADVSELLKPQLAVVREAYLRAVRIEAMGDCE